MQAEPQSKTVYVNRINMHYWDWGGKGRPAIVMLHPSFGFGRVWDFLARQLRADYRVLCPDQRGHGDTDKPARGYAPEDYKADLEAFTKKLGLDKVIIVGHSLGSRVGMTFAAENPDRISHLILVGGPHFISLFPSDNAEKEKRGGRLLAQESVQVSFSSAEEAMESLRSPNSVHEYPAVAISHIVKYNMNHNPGGSVEWKWHKNAVLQTLSHIAADDLKPYVKRITCPILIPWGKRTRDLTPERVPIVKPLFPTARWVFMEGIEGPIHRMYLEFPEALSKVIREFLAH